MVLDSQMARRNQNMLHVRNMLGLENIRSKHEHTHTWRSTRHVQTLPIQHCVYCAGPGFDVNLSRKETLIIWGDGTGAKGNSRCNGPRETPSVVIHMVGTNTILGT